jgi:segregation and condensation protein B
MNETESIIESLLFASDRPLPARALAELLENVEVQDIEEAIESLRKLYDQGGHSFQILQIAGGYQICTRSQYAKWIRGLFHSRTRSRLSRPALETLAIIAYKQPILRAEIESLRGVRVDGILQSLLERKLIAIKGRKATVGRPLFYGTTTEFLRHFGLRDIDDLPAEGELRVLKESPKSSESLVTEYEGEAEQIPSPARGDIQAPGGSAHPGGTGQGEWPGDQRAGSAG